MPNITSLWTMFEGLATGLAAVLAAVFLIRLGVAIRASRRFN